MYDFIIIGGGPAGISAAVYAVSRGLRVLVLEQEKIGGVIGKVSIVSHYTAIVEGETGETFAARMKKQALDAGVQISYETVVEVQLTGKTKIVKTNSDVYESRAVLLANGTTPRTLGIPGEDALTGKGYALNAAKSAQAYAGKHVYVVGGADGAIKEALYLSRFAKKVFIIHFEDKLGAIPEFTNKLAQLGNVELLLHSRLTEIGGKGQVEWLQLTDEKTGVTTKIEDEGCGIFVYAGATPNTQLYPELHLENGYIPVNEKMETMYQGVYAAGDICVKQVRQAATAVADGAVAAINAAQCCKIITHSFITVKFYHIPKKSHTLYGFFP